MEETPDKNVNKKLIPTDILCERCGSMMVKRLGNRGYSLSCSSYPQCDYTRGVEETEQDQVVNGAPCEKCGSPMVIKNRSSGQFLACSSYPTCNFTREIDTGVRCPQKKCDGMLVEQRNGMGGVYYRCSNYPRCTFALCDKPVSEESPRSLWDAPEMSTTSSISDEGFENKKEIGNGQGIDDYPVAQTYRTHDLPYIPELPEQKPQVFIPAETVEDQPDVQKQEPDGETSDLISILVNDRPSPKKNEKGNKPFPASNNESELNIEDILLEIERVLRGTGCLQVRRNFNELEADFTKCTDSFTTIFHVYNGMVSAITLLSFVKGVSIDLLTLCGQPGFISSVGIVLQKNKPCYVVKSIYPLKALSREVLSEMVSQTILDASKVNEIINSRKQLER